MRKLLMSLVLLGFAVLVVAVAVYRTVASNSSHTLHIANLQNANHATDEADAPGAKDSATNQEVCGGRASKKLLNDSQAKLVSLAPKATTIARLVSQPYNPSAGRPRDAFSLSTWRISGTIVVVKYESDHDLHVVMSDGTRTMIVEAPDPTCATGSVVLPQIKAVRAAIIKQFPTLKLYAGAPSIFPNVHATVTGVGFMDTVHGQTGVAPDGAELHPLTSFKVG